MTIKKKTTYVDSDGFEYTFEPIEESLKIKKIKGGYEARYLVQDNDAQSPKDWDDDGVFLVNYHKDFWVESDKVTKDEIVDLYRGEPVEGYWAFPLSCLVHSGVWLSLNHGFACDAQGWDTSHVGAVLVSKDEFDTEEKAREAAKSIVEVWNQYLQGDVYGIVKEVYDKKKKQITQDSVWGFYGQENALESLETEI